MNHLIRYFSINRVDFFLLMPALILVSISLAVLYSIDSMIFRQQLFALFMAVVAYILFLSVDYKIFGFFTKQMYTGILVSLLTIFIIGIEAKGAARWIDVFGIRIQFSEIIKPFFVMVLAHHLTKDDLHDLRKFVTSLLLLTPVFILVLRQPDLGNALIYLATSILMMIVYGFPFKYFATLFGGAALLAPLFLSLLKDYQKERLLSFMNSTTDPFGSSYNAIQSQISIGSGGFFGKGFGQATQSILRFLPERHTDFIFATLTESIGFLGGIVILCLFLFLLYRIYIIALNAPDSFAYITSIGMFFLLLTHTFLNIGMNLGILPIVGITLPLLSYGGSSLVTNFVILSILSSIRFDEKKTTLFEIR